VEVVEPFKEAIDMIKEAGGDAFRLCFQCGLCTASCPWNQVRTFMPHKMITQSRFGLVELGEENWWLCSTCNVCVDRCPRGVVITDIMRSIRSITLEFDYRSAPESLRSAMGSLLGSGNPWGGDRDYRTDWTKNLEVKTFDENSELLFFTCCTPDYDPKMVNVNKAMIRILRETGSNYGILGNKSSCCGESVRKAGNNQVFEELAKNNIDAFNRAGVKEIIVTSPHCYVTFKDDYPEMGAELKVSHYSQYLVYLITRGRLTFKKPYPKKVVYHDPCYLGRHSGVYDEPRKVLASIPELILMDEKNTRENSLCCGGGGGRIWMETQKGERFSDILVEQAVEMGAEVLATTCPYCILNFKDSVLTTENEGNLEIMDLCEIVDEVI
jgi:Fe-S oxidoreductase